MSKGWALWPNCRYSEDTFDDSLAVVLQALWEAGIGISIGAQAGIKTDSRSSHLLVEQIVGEMAFRKCGRKMAETKKSRGFSASGLHDSQREVLERGLEPPRVTPLDP
jgi:hypothetical protein